MKKIAFVIASAVVASSALAAGTTICAAPTQAGNGTQIAGNVGYGGSASGFVINAFTPKCSANVFAAIEQSEISLATAAGSKKGKNLFTGSTNGGGVKPTGATFNGVAESDVTGATANALASSS